MKTPISTSVQLREQSMDTINGVRRDLHHGDTEFADYASPAETRLPQAADIYGTHSAPSDSRAQSIAATGFLSAPDALLREP